MLDRRELLQSLAGMTAGMALGDYAFSAPIKGPSDRLGELLPLRSFGKIGDKVTMLGLGGEHIGRGSEAHGQKIIETALENGVRFFDNAEQYHGGVSEERMGKFISKKYRDVAYLMTKTTAKDAKTAREHLEGSLRRFNTDYIDLWQMHAIGSVDDAERRVNNGVRDVMLQAQQEGKVRHIGFTGHRYPEHHERMLELFPEAQALQMPINVADPSYNSFIEKVLPKAVDQNVGVVAMKTLTHGGFWGARGFMQSSEGPGPKLVPEVMSVEEAMSFVWSLPVSVAITGAEDPAMLEEKVTFAKRFEKMKAEDRRALVNKVADRIQDDNPEFYKA
jgi:predicted aldo/keto reductase-like oxidoreductase